MVADDVTAFGNLAYEVWMLYRRLTNEKECRANAVPLEQRQQAWRELRMRPVVEGQRRDRLRCLHADNGPSQRDRKAECDVALTHARTRRCRGRCRGRGRGRGRRRSRSRSRSRSNHGPHVVTHAGSMARSTTAGLPAITTSAGNTPLHTAPKPTTLFSPISLPGRMPLCAPIQTLRAT